MGISLEWVEFQRPEEFAAIFDHAHKQGIETVIVLSSPQSYHHAAEIAKMAIDAKMVTIGTFKHYAMSGFLISYASDLVDSLSAGSSLRGQDSQWRETGRSPD